MFVYSSRPFILHLLILFAHRRRYLLCIWSLFGWVLYNNISINPFLISSYVLSFNIHFLPHCFASILFIPGSCVGLRDFRATPFHPNVSRNFSEFFFWAVDRVSHAYRTQVAVITIIIIIVTILSCSDIEEDLRVIYSSSIVVIVVVVVIIIIVIIIIALLLLPLRPENSAEDDSHRRDVLAPSRKSRHVHNLSDFRVRPRREPFPIDSRRPPPRRVPRPCIQAGFVE